MPKRLSFVPRTTAYATVDPLALTNVEDALEALQKAFRDRNMPATTTSPEHANDVADSEPSSGNANGQG